MKRVLLLLFFLNSTLGFASSIICPEKINTKQSLYSSVDSWSQFQDKNDLHMLRAVDFYDGNPKGMAQLMPENVDSTHDPKWTFTQEQDIWLVCRYTNTKISLTKKMGQKIKNCIVTFNKKVSPKIDLIECH